MAWLYAYGDEGYIQYKGDSGGSNIRYFRNENGEVKTDNGKPQVGSVIQVGSITARSYSSQDWWRTTIIIEIIEEYRDCTNRLNVKFKTGNSLYHWKE